ncbi:hypothetical protein L835_2570 [Mycobacteroides abscessus MAB_110811_1470]|nr:hypothetical protein L835_2570 [Mycobacteroides abscessus MAB_110811_1470]
MGCLRDQLAGSMGCDFRYQNVGNALPKWQARPLLRVLTRPYDHIVK